MPDWTKWGSMGQEWGKSGARVGQKPAKVGQQWGKMDNQFYQNISTLKSVKARFLPCFHTCRQRPEDNVIYAIGGIKKPTK